MNVTRSRCPRTDSSRDSRCLALDEATDPRTGIRRSTYRRPYAQVLGGLLYSSKTDPIGSALTRVPVLLSLLYERFQMRFLRCPC